MPPQDVKGADYALDDVSTEQIRPVENMALLGALFLVFSAVWVAWPSFTGLEVVTVAEFGPPLVLIAWAILLQDLTIFTPVTRSRIAGASSLIWPCIAAVSLSQPISDIWVICGVLACLFVAFMLFLTSRRMLSGRTEVIRYRGIMTGSGAAISVSILLAMGPTSFSLLFGTAPILVAILLSSQDWRGDPKTRSLRREFRQKIDSLEDQLLTLRQTDAPVDQASSLMQRAKEEGFRDPLVGLEIISHAIDELDRSLRFSEDVFAVQQAALFAIQIAQDLYPVKKPGKTFHTAERELSLGSLREAEMLFRQAKKQALEIATWWKKAESSISEAAASLGSITASEADSLRASLSQARKELSREKPKRAYELSSPIPIHVSSIGARSEEAIEAISIAQKVVDDTEGIDTSMWLKGIERAHNALVADDPSLAKGIASSIERDVRFTREARDRTLRSLKQRRKYASRWSNMSDAASWESRFDGIRESADEGRWIEASSSIDSLLSDLDLAGSELNEAVELLTFATGEWGQLDRRFQSAGFELDDDERLNAQKVLSDATKAIEQGDLDGGLHALGDLDQKMERLRRRI